MLYEVITITSYNVCYTKLLRIGKGKGAIDAYLGIDEIIDLVITSYSIHYTKLYDVVADQFAVGDEDGLVVAGPELGGEYRITSYNVCYTKLLRSPGNPYGRWCGPGPRPRVRPGPRSAAPSRRG